MDYNKNNRNEYREFRNKKKYDEVEDQLLAFISRSNTRLLQSRNAAKLSVNDVDAIDNHKLKDNKYAEYSKTENSSMQREKDYKSLIGEKLSVRPVSADFYNGLRKSSKGNKKTQQVTVSNTIVGLSGNDHREIKLVDAFYPKNVEIFSLKEAAKKNVI